MGLAADRQVGPKRGEEVTARQEARADRIFAFWADRFAQTNGVDRAQVAFEYVVARVRDLPKSRRDAAFNVLADELVALADRVTQSELHTSHSHRPGGVPETLRAQARRAGARESQV